MGSLSRTKGAAYEREVAKELFDLTGITFARNLRQYQQAGNDDLIPDDPAFPFSPELKRRAKAYTCADEWKQQATKAAEKQGKLPAVIWRGDHMKSRVSVPMRAFCAAFPADQWVDLSLEGFALLAREIMAGAALTETIEHRGEVG
ncbi:hypothetical protein [Ruegeria sp. HKCCA4812]|uniref:putative PDDEXK endonuclease n=1 Tax=Ruegeria sp. HKCCA4812 TaxID=2682993 RepID=UPI00148989A2|nr:hypothetical protein [Ruegeria sp. HKCCA4812]